MLSFDEIVNTLKYLGYCTHDREDKLTNHARRVAVACQNRYTESVILPSILGEAWCEACHAANESGVPRAVHVKPFTGPKKPSVPPGFT